MGKKGQVETMGLAIIVILVVFIALIFLRYSGDIVKSEDKYLSIKVNNFLNALKQVDIGESNFEEIAIGCCSGSMAKCDIAKQNVENYVNYLEIGLNDFYFKLECIAQDYGFFVGNCANGVASGKIVLVTADIMSAKICRGD